MATEYSRTMLRVATAQIAQSLGWNAVQSTPMELLTDVLERYIGEMGHHTQRYAEQFGRTMPNLDDLGLAFRDVGVSLPELEDYTQHVEPIPFALDVPKYPAPKESLLHFPKPHSRELLHREEHVDDHLPPMNPEWNDDLLAPAPVATTTDEVTPSLPSLVPGTQPDKRLATSPPESGPAAKKLKSLPEEAGHSQYLMKSVVMSSSGLLTNTPGTVADARTPPPPTPQTPKVGVVPFPPLPAEVTVEVDDDDPSLLTPDDIPDAVKSYTSMGGVQTESVPALGPVETKSSLKLLTQSPKVSTKSPKGKLGKLGTQSPKASPKGPKGEKSPKIPKIGKSPKVKKIKTPKLVTSSTPKNVKSPKKAKGGFGSPGRSPGRPRKTPLPAPQLDELLVKNEPMGDQYSPPETIDSALPVGRVPDQSPIRVLDLSAPKMEVPLRTKAAMKVMPPELLGQPGFMSPPGPWQQPPQETFVAKETRLASYDDAIQTVLEKIQPVGEVTVKQEEEEVEDFMLPDDDIIMEKPKTKAERKQKKIKTEPGVTDLLSEPLSALPPPPPVPTPSDVYSFEDTAPSTVSSLSPRKPGRLILPSLPSEEEADSVRAASSEPDSVRSPDRGRPHSSERSSSRATSSERPTSRAPSSEKSFSPQVLIPPMTPEDIRRFSFSPEKKVSPEPEPTQPPIQPITINMSLPKLSIKLPKKEKSESAKKEKKKKKNKDRDKDRDREREKSKEKKDKNRDKERKKDKKDKEKKEKCKEEFTTVGGQGFPKLTLKFGGLKSATPTMSMANPEDSPSQKAVKLKIRPMSDPVESPPRPSPAPVPSPSPPPVALRSPSPALPLSPTVSFSPLPSPAPQIELPPSPFSSQSDEPPPGRIEPPQDSAARYQDSAARYQSSGDARYQASGDARYQDSDARYPSHLDSDDPPRDSDDDAGVDESPAEGGARAIIAETEGTIKDENGETIWICPSCKMPDDGSPMIGCDKCDDWYHWPCVGIKKEPPSNKDWYCPRCQLTVGKKKPGRGRPPRKKTPKK